MERAGLVARSDPGMVRRQSGTAVLRKGRAPSQKAISAFRVEGCPHSIQSDCSLKNKIVLAILGFAAILPAGVASA